MNPPHHECWWSCKKMCEVELDASAGRLSGAGIGLSVLETGCTYVSGRFASEPEDDENTNLSIELPEDAGLLRVCGSVHDDCFFTLQPVPIRLVEAICRAVLEQQAGYAGSQAGLETVSARLSQVLRQYGCLRFRTEPRRMQVTIEIVKWDSPVFGRWFRCIGRVRLDGVQAEVDIPNKSLHATAARAGS